MNRSKRKLLAYFLIKQLVGDEKEVAILQIDEMRRVTLSRKTKTQCFYFTVDGVLRLSYYVVRGV